MQALRESARPVPPRRAFCVALSPRPRSTQDYSVPAPPRVKSAPGPRGRCRAAGFWRREPLNRVSRLSEESRTAHGASDIQRCLEVDPRVVLRLSRDEPAPRHRGVARAKAPAKPVGPQAAGASRRVRPHRDADLRQIPIVGPQKGPACQEISSSFRYPPKRWVCTGSRPRSGTSPRRLATMLRHIGSYHIEGAIIR